MSNEPTDTDRLDFLIETGSDFMDRGNSWRGRYWVVVPPLPSVPLGEIFYANDPRAVIDQAREKLGPERRENAKNRHRLD